MTSVRPEPWLPASLRLLRCAVAAVSIGCMLLFLYTALRRMRYPFELEWIEDGVLLSVRRIVHGDALYTAPTLHFVPFLYAPVYLYLAAALAKITGVGYTTLRLLSTLATLGSFGLIFALVYRETRNRLAGLAAAGLFAALYPTVEAFYDIGRVDSLFVFFLLLGIYATRYTHPLLAAFVWLIAFQTKQTILPIALLVLLAEWKRPRRAIMGVAAFLILAATSVGILNHVTQGWYSFYCFGAARGFPIVWRQAGLYLPQALLLPLGIAFTLIAAALLLSRTLREDKLSLLLHFYTIVSVGFYAAIWFVVAHRGAAVNALIPVYAWTAVLFGIAFAKLLTHLETDESGYSIHAACVVLLAVFIQIAGHIENPGRYIPPVKVLEERHAFVAQLGTIPGEVYLLDHNYDAVLAHRNEHAEGEAIGAVMDAPGATNRALAQEYKAAFESGRFSAVVSDIAPDAVASFISSAYPVAIAAAGSSGERFLTSQPRWILLPCSAVQNGLLKQLEQPNLAVQYGSCPH